MRFGKIGGEVTVRISVHPLPVGDIPYCVWLNHRLLQAAAPSCWLQPSESVVKKVSRTENRIQSDKVVELSTVLTTKYKTTVLWNGQHSRKMTERTERQVKMNNMIETERLILMPLNYDQLVKYSKCNNSLEEELNLHKTSRTISSELKDALERTILPNVADKSKNYLYSTLWTAISKTENRMIGDFCIYGEPNENGEIEIGYGTYEEFQNRGYMTEVVSGIIEWTKKQTIVKSIIASTEKINIASFRVLEKNGFTKIGETDTLTNWELEIRN